MKKIVIIALILSAFLACKKDCEECKTCDNPTGDSTCKTDLTKGLLAYYPFTGNFNDASGNGNNGTAVNGAFLTSDFLGRASQAAGFDGINDYVIVPGSPKLNADTVTIAFQILTNKINRTNVSVSKINFQTGSSLSYGIHSQASENKWGFGLQPGTDPCSKMDSYDTAGTVYAKQTMEVGRWYNVICSFAHGVQNIYIDGMLVGTKTRTFLNAKKCDNGDLMIGGWWKNDIVSIDGKIDEVRLYNRLLTDCEISKLSQSWNQ